MSIQYKKNKNKGFTIIETLVAITVLMIALAGPLVAANRGLTGAIYSKDQLIASYLAQDSMEFIKFRKNNNIFAYNKSLGSGWLQGFESCTTDSVATGYCDAGSYDGDIITGCIVTGCPLFDESGSYSHVANSNRPIFYRQFTLVKVDDNEYIAKVSVFWVSGSIKNEIDLSSVITNITRQLI